MDFDKISEIRVAWNNFLTQKSEIISQMQIRAAGIHESVNQKYDELPYSFHTNMVSNFFMQYAPDCFLDYNEYANIIQSDGLAAIFGAIFHDTIEDCRLTYNDVMNIANGYMGKAQAELAADIVYALTNEKGKTRDERANDRYYQGILNTPYAPCIKLCDRYANSIYAVSRKSSMAKKYATEMKHFIGQIMRRDDSKYMLPNDLVRLCLSYPLCTGNETICEDLEILAELKRQLASSK